MRTEYIFPFILFIPVLIIQITILPFFALEGAVPDLILILLVFYGIKYGHITGTVLGFFYGLFFDLITGGLLGSAMFTKTLSGFVAGYFSNENKLDFYLRSFGFSLGVLVCAIIDEITYDFLSGSEFSNNLLASFFQEGLLPGIYTAVLSLIVLAFQKRRRFF